MSAALAVREVAATPYRAERLRLRFAERAQHAYPSPDAAELDALEQLGAEISTLSAHIHAATHRLLILIAEFDRKRGWEHDGQRSCAHWLSFRTGIDLGAAREKVRAARALECLPSTSAAMARGQLSFSQVRALTRVAQPDTEDALLGLARGATIAQLERMVRAYRKNSRMDEALAERECHESRTVSVFPDDDGMYVIHGRLTPEVGALLLRALEAAGDALFRERRVTAGEDSNREAAQRRADALGLLAERALAAGMNTHGSEDATADTCEQQVPISGTRARRYQVVLSVDAVALSAEAGPGRSELEDGTRVSQETSRRLACDASVVRVTHDHRGGVLDIGRKTRTIPPALRRALEVRDRGCRFPGCGLRFTDAHHVRHWADGGETSLANCLLLCAHHHRLVHEGDWRIEWWGRERPAFVDPRGQAHFDGGWRPPQFRIDPVAAMRDANHARGVSPDEWTASATWKCEADIPADIYFRALEVL